MYDATIIYRIALDYYINNLSQEEIARRENISRPQISRMLKKARESGIVKIEISNPRSMQIADLQRAMECSLGLERVLISASSAVAAENDAAFYSFAANYLCTLIGQYRNIGIGWGKTLYHISLQLPYTAENEKVTFYPLIGNSGTNNPYFQTNSICDRFAERFHANVFFHNLLAIMPKGSVSGLSLERLDRLRIAWQDLDLMVVGLGGQLNTDVPYIEEFPRNAIMNKEMKRVMGDLLGTFVLDDESVLRVPNGYQIIAVRLKDFSCAKAVIGIAHGVQKVDFIIYAARKGYIKTLVTDSDTAFSILEKLGKI